MINLQKALKYPFEQKNWETKVGILFLFYLASSLVSTTTSFDSQSTRELVNDLVRNGQINTHFIQPAINSVGIYRSFWLLILQFALIPISLYVTGYEFSFTKNVMNGKEEALEEHGDFLGFIKLGLAKILLGIPLSLVFILLIVAIMLLTMVTTYGVGLNAEIGLGLITSVLVFIVLLVPGSILLSLFNSAIYYNYLSGTGFWGAFKPSKVMETFKKGWKDFLVSIALQFAVGIGALIVSLLLICFSFITSPAITVYTQLVAAHLYGQAFNKLRSSTR